ncbi:MULTISPECIES: cytochrome ubiquinol oxidase subunit I [unclassified Streptomyces]|uniref:cytochrome ubiquinol oxidase subunit I n=1 Tax=unclassified Streptomyces TaxID=2593676 RepID=UPI002E2D8688|nr:cytochrome ubiquinol oxidase subunit I [Streptomyces sp. NBC_00273]
MNTAELARLQFAVTAGLHFLFVALTLGLVTVVAVTQTRATRARDRQARATGMRRVRFWGGLYVINYALGIISGIVQEFQFGLNWSGLSDAMGNVIGTPVAIETIAAFFLESTFLGMWAFGFGRLPARAHLVLIWLVALTAYASTFWIMVVNGFMQKPVGHETSGGVTRVTDWGAILTNEATWYALAHIAGAVALLAGLFIAAVSASHLRRDHEVDFFRPTLAQGGLLAGAGALVTVVAGLVHLEALAGYQPAKYAVVTGEGPSPEEVNAAEVARHGPGDWLPPDWVGIPTLLMIVIGVILVLVAWIPATAARRTDVPPSRRRFRMRFAVMLLPFGFIALICGWLTREVGRQPWAVTGELTVEEAVSDVSFGAMLTTVLVLTTVLALLAVVDWALLTHYARLGPDGAFIGGADLMPEPDDPTAPADPAGRNGAAAGRDPGSADAHFSY